jgi:hypothetical protein
LSSFAAGGGSAFAFEVASVAFEVEVAFAFEVAVASR